MLQQGHSRGMVPEAFGAGTACLQAVTQQEGWTGCLEYFHDVSIANARSVTGAGADA